MGTTGQIRLANRMGQSLALMAYLPGKQERHHPDALKACQSAILVRFDRTYLVHPTMMRNLSWVVVL
jgi:hypothetical protein